ncbi:MAG: lipoate--protein ligase family protein [Chthoniobacterales bacterium]
MPNETFARLRVLRDEERSSAALNMAIDEALLLSARDPVLRFYGWRGPSISFGYFGCYADVVAEEAQCEIVRRWTGGGVVWHGTDLTYSVILPRGSVSEMPSPRAAYEKIHSAMREALRGQLDAILVEKDSPKISEACFANPVFADVLLDGRKIAGAAQRRSRAGLLHQGSIQCEDLPDDFSESFARRLGGDFVTMGLDVEVKERARELAEAKYGTAEWLRRR